MYRKGYSAPTGRPVGASYPTPNGSAGDGFRGVRLPGRSDGTRPGSDDPSPSAPRSRAGTRGFIAGATLWAIAVMQLPHWLATKATDGVVGNLTGVLALTGIGAALLAVGFTRRKQNR